MPQFDVVGAGLNATDTLILIPRFPPLGGKVRFQREVISPGGQVASALAACARLGLRTKYIGTMGDDERGRVQLESLKASGINLDDIQIRKGCPNQSAYILVDGETGERTVIWDRSESLRLEPDEITPQMIQCARLLLVDGHDAPAAARAARLARQAGIPVVVDVDTIYDGFAGVLETADYLIGSAEFPAAWTGLNDPFQALTAIQEKYGMALAAMTLGARGALARFEKRFFYSPGFVVNCIDTTGAGDVFHGAFCYAVLESLPLPEALDFANAMAALNCTALGARGGIATLEEVRALMNHGERRLHPDISARADA